MESKQQIAIFTTASLPWMTGTAVNPLFRAAYLARFDERKVTLVIPWLSLEDQELVYPTHITFLSPAEHEIYVRQWLEKRTSFKSEFDIRFYPAKFAADKRSILAVGDLTEIIPNEEADVAVLEEPEHLTWYHHGRRWKTKFRKVIGVVHTNYLEYVKRERNGLIQAFLLKHLNNWVIYIYCHKVIRLSAATQDTPRSIICNVHGVNPMFIDIGKQQQEQRQKGAQIFTRSAYYIGKMVWSKGYKELLQLISRNQNKLSDLQMDLHGSGEDSEQVKQAAKKLKLTITVNPGRDHADPLFHEYKLFINPSTTDVVCTTTAEALAMGKIVICANHPSNDFFKQFSNCRMYDNNDGFVREVLKALSDEPKSLTDDERHALSWEAATERFLKASDLDHAFPEMTTMTPPRPFMSLSLKTAEFRKKIEDMSALMHYTMSGNEKLRCAFGAIPRSLQPDEQLCRDLGLTLSTKKKSSKHIL